MVFPFEVIAAENGRVWIPDLVAWCWCELWRFGNWRAAFSCMRPGDQELLGANGKQWRDWAKEGDGWVTDPLLDEVRIINRMGENQKSTALLELLVALDRAGDGLGFGGRGAHPGMEPIWQRWKSKGKLQSENVPVTVLRKAASGYTGGAALEQYLQNYVVCEERDAELQVHPLTGFDAFDTLEESQIRIAFIPTLVCANDAHFVRGRRAKEFLVSLDEAAQQRLQCSAESLVADLERKRVNIAIFPEGCATVEFVRALQRALSANASRLGPSRCLKLLFVGVCGPTRTGGAVYNTVQVYKGNGRHLCEQTKFHPWHLDVKQRERYGVAENWELEAIDLQQPPVLNLIESDGLGRLSILICEDLVRANTARNLVVDTNASIVVGPVMDDSLEVNCWAYFAARQLSINEPQSVVLVANSAWLSAVAGVRSRRHSDSTRQPGIGIVSDALNPRIIRMAEESLYMIDQVDLPALLQPSRSL